MNKILTPIIMILLGTLVIAAIPTEAEAAIYDDTVRLHILAPSDSAEDQALKLRIRDLVLEKYSSYLSLSESTEDAKARIGAVLPSIEDDVEAWIYESGYSYGAEVTLGEEWYGTREYESFTLPAGTYTSLKIVIGEGEGKNWWCVMYPPLCLDIATEPATGYTDSEQGLISRSGYRVKFKILEVISALTRGR